MAEDNIKETISALMDGELNEREMHDVVRCLRENKEHQECWQNYHLIGDALRKNLPSEMDSQLLSRITQSIASEPSYSASLAEFPSKQTNSVSNKQFKAKPIAGFALAASVAAVAYVGVGMLSMEEELSGASRLAATSPVVPPTTVAPMVVADQFRAQPTTTSWDVAQPAVESKLNGYLSNHQAAVGAVGMNGRIMPYAGIVVVEKSARAE